jgi:hypothetical protein
MSDGKNTVEYSDYVSIRGIEVRERRVGFVEKDGSEHISIFVEDRNGDVLFAPEFLSHTNEYAKVEVCVHLPNHEPEYYEIVDYDLTSHSMKGRKIAHPAAQPEFEDDDEE